MTGRDEYYEYFSALVERMRAEAKRRGTLPHNPLPVDWDSRELSRLWDLFNDQKTRERAAQSTYDAVLWVLRTHGVARLADDWMLPRLTEFSDAQMNELIAAMHRLKAKGQWPNVTADLIDKLESLNDRRQV